MPDPKRFFLRLYNVVRPGRAEQQLAREISSHLSLHEEDLRRRGMTAEEARLAARRAFGGIEQTKEVQRDARSFVWLEDTRRDIGYTVRTLRRTPGFTVVAVVTLALGIGANTAIFSVVNAVLLRPLPYPESDRLVRIIQNIPATDGSGAPLQRAVGLTLSDLASFREQAKLLSHIGVYAPTTMMLTGRGEAVRLEGTRLSPAVLAMAGARPRAGRIFDPREEAPGADAVVVVSHAFWQRHLAGAPDALGQSLTLDGRSYSVIGVMPAGFQFPDSQTQLWIPYVLGGFALRARVPPIARLADGVSMKAAGAEVASILQHLGTTAEPQPSGLPQFELAGVQDQLVAPVRPALAVLATAVGFVLLIACLNVANLLLARTATRQREIAVRAALGAGRSRLVRQCLTESTLLALLGGIAGTVLAFGGIRLVQTLGTILPRRDMSVDLGIPRLEEIGIDLTVLAFALVVTLATGIFSGLVPALRQSRRGDTDPLREGASSADAGLNLLGRLRAQGLMVVAEIAMAMLLLVGGGLLIHSFIKLSNVNPGYEPSDVLTFAVYSTRPRVPAGPPPAAGRQRADPSAADILTRLQSLPQVRAAGYAELLPLVRFKSGVRLRTTLEQPAYPPAPPAPGTQVPPELPDTRVVSRDFLNVMGIRVIEGRGFGDDDTEGRAKVLLINRTLARSGFLGPSPIGTRVYAAGNAPWEIIGIVEDVRQYGLDQAADPQMFIDVRQLPMGNPNPYFAVRAHGDPVALASTIRAMVNQLDPHAMVDNVATMEQLVSNSIARPRLYAVLIGLFAVVAGTLAIIGIYGVMAYSVAQRTREFGIRVALGAARTDVTRLVLGQSLVMTALGIGLGLAGAAALTRYLDRMLFGLSPLDSTTFVLVSALFAVVATFASYVPARRATKVDPMVALRQP